MTLKVTLIGAAGRVGQPLSMLLKSNLPDDSELALYDIEKAKGVAEDISHISTNVTVAGYDKKELPDALSGADIVLVVAGGLDLHASASIIQGIATVGAQKCPEALWAIITNPLNAMVPVLFKTLKRHGVEKPTRKVFGVTELDTMRAATFVSKKKRLDVKTVEVPVIGGHGGITAVPLLSKCTSGGDDLLTPDEEEELTNCIQQAAQNVANAKGGSAGAGGTLAAATAVGRFALRLAGARLDKKSVTCGAYVKLNGAAKESIAKTLSIEGQKSISASYFATQVSVGPNGIKEYLDLGDVSDNEKKLVSEMIDGLQEAIVAGEEALHSNDEEEPSQ